MMPTYAVKRFSIRYWSSVASSPATPARALAAILLYGDAGWRGQAYFYPDGSQLPEAGFEQDGGLDLVQLNLNVAQLPAVLDALRRGGAELYYQGPENAGLDTAEESVGTPAPDAGGEHAPDAGRRGAGRAALD